MRQSEKRRIARWTSTALAVGLLCAAPGAQDATRSITPERFLKARPVSPTTKTATHPAYRIVDARRPAKKPPAGAETMEIGVTVWRLRPARPGDAARLLVQEADRASQWTPERIFAGAPLASGDRVRVAIESPQSGYLYVVDRERYADGSEGAPVLIFPTSRTHGGDNRVTGGRLIEIPGQDDRPPYFTMRPGRADQIGERLTIVVTELPIADVAIGAEAITLPAALVAGWEARGALSVEHLEMIGGAGRAWSVAEQRAGADPTRLLKQDDPPPQTLFRVVVARPDLVAVNVLLRTGSQHAAPRGGARED